MTHPKLLKNEIHLWHVSTLHPVPSDQLSALTPEEWARAQSIAIPSKKCEWLTSRIALKALLGAYLGGQSFCLKEDSLGKPCVMPGPLKFSLSHTQGHTLIAITLTYEIGVDIEKLRPLKHQVALTQRSFHEEEAKKTHSEADFFRIWTAKEATLKGSGMSIMHHMKTFRVEFDPDHHTFEAVLAQKRWHGQAVGVPSAYEAHIVCESPGMRVIPFNWRVPRSRPSAYQF